MPFHIKSNATLLSSVPGPMSRVHDALVCRNAIRSTAQSR
jgi:hypothetical protein